MFKQSKGCENNVACFEKIQESRAAARIPPPKCRGVPFGVDP